MALSDCQSPIAVGSPHAAPSPWQGDTRCVTSNILLNSQLNTNGWTSNDSQNRIASARDNNKLLSNSLGTKPAAATLYTNMIDQSNFSPSGGTVITENCGNKLNNDISISARLDANNTYKGKSYHHIVVAN